MLCFEMQTRARAWLSTPHYKLVAKDSLTLTQQHTSAKRSEKASKLENNLEARHVVSAAVLPP